METLLLHRPRLTTSFPVLMLQAGRPLSLGTGTWNNPKVEVLDQILRSTLLSKHTTQPNYRRSFFSTHCSYGLLVGLSLNSGVKDAATLGFILGTCTIEMFVTPSSTCVVLFIHQCRTQTVHGHNSHLSYTSKIQSSKILSSRLIQGSIIIPVLDGLRRLEQSDATWLSKSHLRR